MTLQFMLCLRNSDDKDEKNVKIFKLVCLS